jgi:hypothetical protein
MRLLTAGLQVRVLLAERNNISLPRQSSVGACPDNLLSGPAPTIFCRGSRSGKPKVSTWALCLVLIQFCAGAGCKFESCPPHYITSCLIFTVLHFVAGVCRRREVCAKCVPALPSLAGSLSAAPSGLHARCALLPTANAAGYRLSPLRGE